MRDVHRLRARTNLQLERSHIIWLTLGGLLCLGLAFALGYVSGQRSERLALDLGSPSSSLTQLEKEAQRHRELTFYADLSQEKLPQKEAPKLKQAAVQSAPPKQETKPAPAPPKPDKPKPQAETTAPSKTRRALDLGPARTGEYTIQVSSFQSMEEAKAYSASLERKSFRPFIVAAEIKNKGTWYRVRVGRFADESTAQAAKKILHKADTPAWVLKIE